MNIRHIKACGVLALLLVPAFMPAWAATLAESIRLSVERHPDFRLADSERRVGEGYRRQADSLLGGDPSLDLSVTGDRYGSDFGSEEYTAGISAPVWLPGQRGAKGAIADSIVRLADNMRNKLVWEVAGEVLERAWVWRIAHADMKQSMIQWAGARALVRDVEHRHEVGELSRIDLLLAQQDVVEVEAAHQQAVSAEDLARLAWINFTGLDTLPDDLERCSVVQSGAMLDRHPRMLAALSAVEVAEARVEDARAQRRAPPRVSLYAKRDRGTRLDDYTDSLGVALSLPLGTRGPAATTIAEAEAAHARAKADVRLTRRELALRLSKAEQTLAGAERLLRLARKKHDYSQSRLKLAKRAFELGEMDLYQLLLARRQSYQDSRDLTLRQLERERAAARKNHALGVCAVADD